MSRTVVTPKRRASRNEAAPPTCPCASINPGRSVRPDPSTTGRPDGGAARPTEATRPFLTTTLVLSIVRAPSKTRTFRTTNELPSIGPGVAIAAGDVVVQAAARKATRAVCVKRVARVTMFPVMLSFPFLMVCEACPRPVSNINKLDIDYHDLRYR